jgi:sugar lactone lactonase YvrE
MRRCLAFMRAAGCNGAPALLVVVGAWLSSLGVTVPGAPVVLPGLFPRAVAVDRSGNLYVADGNQAMFEGESPGNVCVWKISPWGARTRAAGSGEARRGADGLPAAHAGLVGPAGLAIDTAGNLYISDAWADCVRRVDRAGVIATVAGSGRSGYAGDGGPAASALLHTPLGLSLDARGRLFIADWGNHCVRVVSPEGVIETLAGGGGPGFGGDGGPARRARLWDPQDIALDADGMLYILDEVNHRVRRVDERGVITTVVGSSPSGHGRGVFGGDGGTATRARLSHPLGLAFGPDAALYIADSDNNRIRRVGADGVITTIMGIGRPGRHRGGFAGDGAPARKAALRHPLDLAFDGQGNLYIADLAQARVRRIGLTGLVSSTAAASGRFGVR